VWKPEGFFHPAAGICAQVLAPVVDVRQIPGTDARVLAKAVQQPSLWLATVKRPGAELLNQGLVVAHSDFVDVHAGAHGYPQIAVKVAQ
jgi:hypothetical protein